MDQEPTNKEHYQRLVGRLIYLAHTRSDIAYAVSVVSQFMHSPSVSHRNAIDRTLRYLKSARGKGLMFSKNRDLEVVGYTYANWAGSITDRCYTSGYFNSWEMSDLIRRRRAVTTTQSSEPPTQPTSAATAPTSAATVPALKDHLAVGPAGSQAPASSASSVAQPVSARRRHRPASTTDTTSTDASGSQPVP
ncbi:secreted RxLR effector protein 161-like [Prunus dulcis]|uniref:secreted RxLR effector protein 161-like n=1 Tax=Prunus dulcis TaxID=3755 RepID=UPI0014830326|nr:secreted RxLR effector protein 161-like [Prunus dulcis]